MELRSLYIQTLLQSIPCFVNRLVIREQYIPALMQYIITTDF
jgi:hypothetical protein